MVDRRRATGDRPKTDRGLASADVWRWPKAADDDRRRHARLSPEEAKKKAFGFVVAEVVKVSDHSGGQYDFSTFGAKTEIRIDGKYVGWVKGPRGKVVQDAPLLMCGNIHAVANFGVRLIPVHSGQSWPGIADSG